MQFACERGRSGSCHSLLIFDPLCRARRAAVWSDLLITETIDGSRVDLQIGVPATEVMHEINARVIVLVGLAQKGTGRMKRTRRNLPFRNIVLGRE